MGLKRQVVLLNVELARLQDQLTLVNLTSLGRQTMPMRGDFQRRIDDQRKAIAIIERAMLSAL